MPELGTLHFVVGFLLLLTPVVYFHELGHYWMARKAGVVVNVFSIGFGPEIYGWTSKKTGTRWRIAAIPLGGYVKMRGDENAASTPAAANGAVEGSFAAASLPWRFGIVLGGPVANFILGILLFALVYGTVGKQFLPAEIGEIMPGSAAEQAGLMQGDLVTEIDGIAIRDFNDMRGLVVESPNKELLFEIVRGGAELSLPVTPKAQYNEQLQITMGLLGVRSVVAGQRERLWPVSAIIAGASDAFHMSAVMLRGLARLGRGEVQSGEIQGPVGIAKISGTVLQQGLVPFIILTAVISINLGLVNLLPIPALDGGHLAFFLYEAIVGRPMPEAVQGVLLRGGIAILLTLTVLLVVFDVGRLFSS